MSSNGESGGVLQQFVERVRGLYTLPAVAMEVLELTDQPDIDVRALKDCIEKDPALTAKILRVVNSSLFGLSGQVSDLKQALALLGVHPLKLLVLGFSLPRNLFDDLESRVLERYWRHTLVKAVASRELMQRFWNLCGDEAFLAGLLQEIGMLALLQDLGESYVRFLDRVYTDEGDLAELETTTLGFDHAVLSARLLDHWGLPRSIVRAVAQRHDAERLMELPAEEQPLAQALHLAELTAVLLTQQQVAALDELRELGARYCGLTLEQLTSLLDSLETKVQQLADVLAVRLPGREDYVRLLLDAQTQLSEAAEEAAEELFVGGRSSGPPAQEAEALVGAFGRRRHAPTPQDAARNGPASPASPAAEPSTSSQTTAVGDPGLLGRVTAAVAACRRQRQAMSLLLLEVDDYDSLIFTLGEESAVSLINLLRSVVDTLAESPHGCIPTRDACFGLILEGYDRQPAVDFAKRIVADIQQWFQRQPGARGINLTFSVGVAAVSVPPKNFPAENLIEAAERCLYGARSGGGDVVKSILIY